MDKVREYLEAGKRLEYENNYRTAFDAAIRLPRYRRLIEALLSWCDYNDAEENIFSIEGNRVDVTTELRELVSRVLLRTVSDEVQGFCRCKHHCSVHAGEKMTGRCAFFEFEDCRCTGFVPAESNDGASSSVSHLSGVRADE